MGVLGPTTLLLPLSEVSTGVVSLVLFGRQKAVCLNKQHTNDTFGCSQFQKINFCSLLPKFLIYLPKILHTGDTESLDQCGY